MTDLFPRSLNEGSYNLVFYRREEDIAAYRAIGEEKARLLADGAYRGAARERLAVDFGRLLGYREDDIARLMAENSDWEP